MDPHDLVAHAAGVRALAGSLLADPGAADDVVQDACVAALARSSETAPPGRPWFVGVVRNLARRTRRDAARRERRERVAARPEAVPPAVQVAATIEAHRRLVEAVRGLDDPYRSAIVLRYFDALGPREIAARHGVPRATASTWIHRGLAMLRARLGREDDWRAALAVLVPSPHPGTMPLRNPIRPVAGVLAMHSKKMLVVLALCLLLAAGAVTVVIAVNARPAGDDGAGPVAGSPGASPATGPRPPETGRPPGGRARAAPPETGAEAGTAEPNSPVAPTLADRYAGPVPPGTHRFRVVDPEGRDISPVRLIVTMSAAGPDSQPLRFDVTTDVSALNFAHAGDIASIDVRPTEPGDPDVLPAVRRAFLESIAPKQAADPPLLPTLGFVPAPGARDHRIVLERGAWLRVRVVTPGDTPLAGASLVLRAPGVPDRMIRTGAVGRAVADVRRDSVFSVALDGEVVEVANGKVSNVLIPWRGEIRDVRPGDEAILRAEPLPRDAFSVRVRGPDGRPAARVRVQVFLGSRGTPFDESVTDGDGIARTGEVPVRTYRIGLAVPDAAPGGPVWLAPPPVEAAPGPDVLELRLLPSRTVSGVVVGEDGASKGRARVAVTRGADEVASAASDDDGTFRVALPATVDGPVTVSARVWLPDGKVLDGVVLGVPPGSDAVRVVVRSQP